MAEDDPRVLGDRYEIHRHLARGGMAQVYLARDRALDRPVAVKELVPEFATDPSFVERFRREAQSAARLTHPNVVAVYDWGTQDGTYFIVMEYVDGPSLSQLIRRDGALHPRRAAEIASEVAAALGFAHSQGVVHRDVKPGNVLLTASGQAKVADFGIARAMSSVDEELTQTGSVMGTATYFSPEQAQGLPVDARADLYSLGVVLYEMVAGRPPFSGDTPLAIAYKHVQDLPARPSTIVPDIPVGLEAIIMKLLQKQPLDRYASAEDVRADLNRFLSGETTFAEASLVSAGASVAAASATTVQPAVAEEFDEFDEDEPRS
ncbi:MAG: serine/threonine protein kinase, partial [Acidobacteria bacterium]|nr:serine/threonine protein kinase [Acidobacteriota bacterium]